MKKKDEKNNFYKLKKLKKEKSKRKNYFREIRAKVPLQNGPVTKWATPKRATTKRAAEKWSRQKYVLPIDTKIESYFSNFEHDLPSV